MRKPHERQDGEVLRGVHPKSHGCVDATFTVNGNNAGDYGFGLFEQPGTYNAMIRYSNAQVLNLEDLFEKKDGSRGMAIKVFGVNGPILFEDGGAKNQDFLMVNTPEFAFRDVRDYLRLTRVLLAHPFGANPKPYFAPLVLKAFGKMDDSGKLSPAAPDEPEILKNARQEFKLEAFEGFTSKDLQGTEQSKDAVDNILSRTVKNPLEAQYYSASPFRYGPDRVMKFSVVPVDGEVLRSKFSPEEMEKLDRDYLAQALKKTMTQGKTIHLSFKVQVVGASDLKGHEKEMIENAALTWDEEKYPFVEVARIEIQPVSGSTNIVDACKTLLFTPWHSLKAHEPLGGINRLRKPIYNKSEECRRNAADDAEKGPCSRNE
jgi:hypothetical protein